TSRSAPARSYPHSHSHHTPSNPAEATREINTALPGLHSPASRRLAVAGNCPSDVPSRDSWEDSSLVKSSLAATHSRRLRHPSPAAPAADPPRPPTPPAGPPHDASPAPRTATPLRPDPWSGPGCLLPRCLLPPCQCSNPTTWVGQKRAGGTGSPTAADHPGHGRPSAHGPR